MKALSNHSDWETCLCECECTVKNVVSTDSQKTHQLGVPRTLLCALTIHLLFTFIFVMSFPNDEEDMSELVDEVELLDSESNPASFTGSVVAEVHPMRTADNNLCMVLVVVLILHLDVEMLTGHH